MKKETNPGIIAAAIVGLIAVVGLIAYFSLRGPQANTSPQAQSELKQMKDDPISQGKDK